MSVIELDTLSKWYGEVIGLNNVTTSVGKGITGLLGPNGAGKSTLMGLATGQLRPSKGAIRVFGQRVWDNPSVLSRIGYCPEGDAFWPELTGWQFVLFLARASGLTGARAREAARHAIEMAGMSKDAGRPIRGYSKGMRQRIKIAQTLAHRPRLLVLDEPFTGADPVARQQVADLLRRLAAEGVDILISSHVLHEVEALTSRILMIDRGRIVAEGDLHAVRRRLRDKPHTIRIRLDAPRRLAAKMVGMEFVTGVTTTEPDRVYDRVPELVLADNLRVREIAPADESLEAVFGYLTDQRV